jgi:hypothetical protein
MLEALKSLYMTGFSDSWRKARPFAAPTAIFVLADHGNDTEYPKNSKNTCQLSGCFSYCKMIVVYLHNKLNLGFPKKHTSK